MAYSHKEWETARAFYERGLSLSEIVARPEVNITDRSSISKRAKQDGWIKGAKSILVEKELEVKQNVAAISEVKSTLNSTELEVHNTLVSERARDDTFFRSASLLIAQTAVKKVQAESLKCSMADLRAAQEVVGKGKENIYGKSPDTAIQINNANGQEGVTEIRRTIIDPRHSDAEGIRTAP